MRAKRNFDHELAAKARTRVSTIIDQVDPIELVSAIKRAPSLRGMILGYIAEEMFEKHLTEEFRGRIQEIVKHDDHDRTANKSDRTLTYNGRRYTVQLKSIQTNSIHVNRAGVLCATVQNDASDNRQIKLPNGSYVTTTCYAVGEFDILAVPMFPFTGKWDFAYKLNSKCRTTTSTKYSEDDRPYLLATTEILTFPLDENWTSDIFSLLTPDVGIPATFSNADPEIAAYEEQVKSGLLISQ